MNYLSKVLFNLREGKNLSKFRMDVIFSLKAVLVALRLIHIGGKVFGPIFFYIITSSTEKRIIIYIKNHLVSQLKNNMFLFSIDFSLSAMKMMLKKKMTMMASCRENCFYLVFPNLR